MVGERADMKEVKQLYAYIHNLPDGGKKIAAVGDATNTVPLMSTREADIAEMQPIIKDMRDAGCDLTLYKFALAAPVDEAEVVGIGKAEHQIASGAPKPTTGIFIPGMVAEA